MTHLDGLDQTSPEAFKARLLKFREIDQRPPQLLPSRRIYLFMALTQELASLKPEGRAAYVARKQAGIQHVLRELSSIFAELPVSEQKMVSEQKQQLSQLLQKVDSKQLRMSARSLTQT